MYYRTDHPALCVPNNKRRQCAGEGCSSIGRTEFKICTAEITIEWFCVLIPNKWSNDIFNLWNKINI